MILPKEDKYYSTKTKMKEQIVHLLGGRVAEKLTLHDISTGASNDIARATEIAKDMVTKYGFSDKLGTVNYSSSDEVFLGKDFSTRKNYSEEIASAIDEEVKRIIEEAFIEAEKILIENEEKLHVVAKSLLEVETLDGEQFEKLYVGAMTPLELASNVKQKEDAIREANEKESEEAERLRKLERQRQREKQRAQNRRSYEPVSGDSEADVDDDETGSGDVDDDDLDKIDDDDDDYEYDDSKYYEEDESDYEYDDGYDDDNDKKHNEDKGELREK